MSLRDWVVLGAILGLVALTIFALSGGDGWIRKDEGIWTRACEDGQTEWMVRCKDGSMIQYKMPK